MNAPEPAPGGGGPAGRRALIDRLDGMIARIEDRTPYLPSGETARGNTRQSLRLGVAQIDMALGGRDKGPALHALHEIRSRLAVDLPAAAGFALALGGILAGFGREIFWIGVEEAQSEAGRFYGPGLEALGFDPQRLVRVAARDCREALWAAGEVAATPGAGLCLVELRGNPAAGDLAFSRRIALRAQDAGVSVILLRQSGVAQASAAATRWCVRPVRLLQENEQEKGRGWVGPPAWNVELEKCRGGRPGAWNLEWNPHERLFVPIPDNAIFRPGSFGRTGAQISGDQPAIALHRSAGAAALGYGLAHERAS